MANWKKALTAKEHALLRKLNTPQKIQDYLDTLPINFEEKRETYMSPRRVLQMKTAHCLEGALLAAAALWYHGKKPLLLDLKTVDYDEDHVVTLFQEHGRWGAISKTNHTILRYRDPVYISIRELVMSYFHEYFLSDRKKTLRSYSKPFDLSRFPAEKWVTPDGELEWLVDKIDSSRHFPIAPARSIKKLRKTSKAEIRILDIEEWKDPRY